MMGVPSSSVKFNSPMLLSLARYYPRNTVIPVVIPQKSCFARRAKNHEDIYRSIPNHGHIRVRIGFYLWSKGRASARTGKAPKYESKCHHLSKKKSFLEQRIFFCSFFLLDFFSVSSFPDHHLFQSFVSHTWSLCPKLGICLHHIPTSRSMCLTLQTHVYIRCCPPPN
jgi:hypothetical protein